MRSKCHVTVCGGQCLHRFGVLLVLGILWMITGCRKEPSADRELILFHAGSLSVPFRELSKVFMQEHPGIVVKAEAAGSRQCARKICDLGRACDVIGSADYRVIENLLMPGYTDFNIRFATNEMVLAYTDRSRFAAQVTLDNWHEVLLRAGVILGRSDPNHDPCGYRALMTCQLAEKHYGIPGLAQRLSTSNCRVRPKETDLLALLELGEIDYLFIYRSVAVQHGLNILHLPDKINLKSTTLASWYKQARVAVTGLRPGQMLERRGEAMIYSVAIPRDAPHPEAARVWIHFLLSSKGRAIMERYGQPCLPSPIVDGRLPKEIVLPSGL